MKIKNYIQAIFLMILPLIFVSNTFNSAVFSGLAFIVVAVMTYFLSLLIDNYLDKDIRIYVYILVMFTLLTIVTLCLKWWVDGVVDQIGIYTASALLNLLLIKNERKDEKINIANAMLVLLISIAVVVFIGFFREVLGTGSLTFFNIQAELFDSRFAVALLSQAAGGFILTALVFAAIQAIFKPYDQESKEVE